MITMFKLLTPDESGALHHEPLYHIIHLFLLFPKRPAESPPPVFSVIYVL